MYNNVTMMGRITNSPELGVTPNGTAVTTFRIAVDRRYQVKGEEKRTDFFNIVAWRKTAEFICKYFAKGRMILVQGEMQTRQYTDKNGNPATWYEIIAEHVSFTGEPKPASAPAEPPELVPPSEPPAEPPKANAVAETDDDDYPF